jgi:hypothetical protein
MRYEFWPQTRGPKTGAVMVPICDANGKTKAWNGRLLNPTDPKNKSHSQGTLTGLYWRHPGIEYDPNRETYITEGVLNSLSWIESGFQSVAVLLSGADPEQIDLSAFPKKVLAFDNDPAGIRAARKWKKKYPDADVVFAPAGQDWNDLLCEHPILDGPENFFQKNLNQFKNNGRLALAESASQYVKIYHDLNAGKLPGLFERDGCYWHSCMIEGADGKKIPGCKRVSDFILKVRHYQFDATVPDRPEYRFYIEIIPQKGKPRQCTVDGEDLCTPGNLNKLFLKRACALWTGEKAASEALLEQIVHSSAPTVRQLQVSGYDLESKWIVFSHVAISPTGSVREISKEGFFEISRDLYLRPAPYILTIKQNSSLPEVKTIYETLIQTWPDVAHVALSWVLASWFSNQIRETVDGNFFPFLSLHGEPGAGKSNLIRRLNQIQMIDEEGLPASKINTQKGQVRKIAQRSGLFTAILELNEERSSRFDMEAALNLYNGSSLQTRAQKTNDNQTNETPFLGALAFIQNADPMRTKAQKERTITLELKKSSFTPETADAFQALSKIPAADFAALGQYLLQQRGTIESSWHAEYVKAQEYLDLIQDARIRNNYALLMAFHRLLCTFTKRTEAFQKQIDILIERMAVDRVEACSARTPDLADYFFEVAFDLDRTEREVILNLDIQQEKGLLWFNLPGLCRAIDQSRIPLKGSTRDLQEALNNHPAHIKHNEPYRFQGTYQKAELNIYVKLIKQKKAWCFDLKKLNGNE